ncbi:MAG: hypothetical protein WCJ11_02005 [Methylococcaceae bacterium]
MYSKTMIGCVCVLIAMSGCTRNKIRQDESNALPRVPTQSEIAHANYGNPITTEEFENAVRSTFKDPYSAKISCTMPEKGWYDLTSQIIYGYFSVCKVNAKNGFGAYTGEDVAVYQKIVGANGEYIDENKYLTFEMKMGKNILHIVK